MKSLRDDYDSCEEKAKMLTDNHMYKGRRGPTRKRFLQEGIENEDNRHLTARDKFRVDTFAVISDSPSVELERRKEAYAGFHERFQVFFQLRWFSSEKIRHLAANLQKAYSSDSEEDFPDEMVRFSGYQNQTDENVSTPVKLLRDIRESDIVDAYSNVEIALTWASAGGKRAFAPPENWN